MCLSQISFFPLIWHLNRGVFDILTSHIHYIDTFSNTQSFPKYVFQYPDLKKLEQVLAKLWQDDILAWVVLLQVAPRDSCLFYHFGQFCLLGQVWKWSRNDVAFFFGSQCINTKENRRTNLFWPILDNFAFLARSENGSETMLLIFLAHKIDAQIYFGHKFWLEGPMDLRSSPLSYIFHALFRETPLGHVHRAQPNNQIAKLPV